MNNEAPFPVLSAIECLTLAQPLCSRLYLFEAGLAMSWLKFGIRANKCPFSHIHGMPPTPLFLPCQHVSPSTASPTVQPFLVMVAGLAAVRDQMAAPPLSQGAQVQAQQGAGLFLDLLSSKDN